MSGARNIVTGAACGALYMAEVTVGAKGGAALGFVGGPAGAAVGAAAGAAVGGLVCVSSFLLKKAFSSGGGRRSGGGNGGGCAGGSSSNAASSGSQRQVREASVGYQLSQAAGQGGATGGSGEDPNWWEKIQENEEELSPIEIFQSIVKAIVARLDRASRSERLRLLKLLVQALFDLLRVHPDIEVRVEANTRNLVLDVPRGDAIQLTPDLVRLMAADSEDNLELGADRDAQTCIYRIRCQDCGTNYVGQTTDRAQRVRNHRHSMTAKDRTKSLYQHHTSHRCVYGCGCDFEGSFVFVVLMEFKQGITYGTGLRAAEVFWQWLLKALEDDGGYGKM